MRRATQLRPARRTLEVGEPGAGRHLVDGHGFDVEPGQPEHFARPPDGEAVLDGGRPPLLDLEAAVAELEPF